MAEEKKAFEDQEAKVPDTEETVEVPENGTAESTQEQETAKAQDAAEEAAESQSCEEAEEETCEENAESSKKGIFGRKKDKEKEALQKKNEELEDRVRRQMAEFENFRKRTDREKSAMFETGAKSVIEKMLPVVDNFERALDMIPEEDREAPFAEGLNKIYKQMVTELENLGVTPIPAVGEEFNPEFHNAVMQVESEEFESGIVAQELLKGYKYRESVVRYSMVAVVQ